jgi:hypothetical protein
MEQMPVRFGMIRFGAGIADNELVELQAVRLVSRTLDHASGVNPQYPLRMSPWARPYVANVSAIRRACFCVSQITNVLGLLQRLRHSGDANSPAMAVLLRARGLNQPIARWANTEDGVTEGVSGNVASGLGRCWMKPPS